MANNKDTEVETCLTELRSVCQTITITGLSQMVEALSELPIQPNAFGGPFSSLDVFGLNRHDPNCANRVMKEAAVIVDDCCDSELSTAADIHVGLCVDQLNLVWAEIVSMTPPVLKMLAAEHFNTNLCSGQFERTLWRPFLGLQYLNLNRDEQTCSHHAEVCLPVNYHYRAVLMQFGKQQNKLMLNQINAMAKQDNLTEEHAKKLENFFKMMEEHGKAFALVFKKSAAIVDECCEHAASTAGDIQELKNCKFIVPALRLFVIKIDHFSLVAKLTGTW
ncbi:hypothetical protein niasHT_013702 [Heterodera trifolii]|uniref:Uncharacterized protein n=1 Tax=Heterodera trifolii TaxID=157864 RepID=A0ABD2LBU9_9BILA